MLHKKAARKDPLVADGSFEWPVDGVVTGPLAVAHPPEHSPQTVVKLPFSGPWFVPALAGIRRLVVHMKAARKDDVMADGSFEWPVDGVVAGPLAVAHLREHPTVRDYAYHLHRRSAFFFSATK